MYKVPLAKKKVILNIHKLECILESQIGLTINEIKELAVKSEDELYKMKKDLQDKLYNQIKTGK